MSTEQFNITDGPTADRVIDSFKYAYVRGTDLPVSFRVGEIGSGSSFVIEAIIKSLAYESGTPGMFMFEADITSHGRGRIKGFYDAKRRQGSFSR